MVDQVDLVAHDSYKQLLAQKDVLRQRMQTTPKADEVDEQGAATTAGALEVPDPTVPTREAMTVEPSVPSTEPTEPGTGLSPVTFTVDGNGEEAALFFVESSDRKAEVTPRPPSRVEGAPPDHVPSS